MARRSWPARARAKYERFAEARDRTSLADQARARRRCDAPRAAARRDRRRRSGHALPVFLRVLRRCREAGRHFITNRAHGALGFSMSAGVGAWFGRPQMRKCVSLMGDGSFGFTCGEMETDRAPQRAAAR